MFCCYSVFCCILFYHSDIYSFFVLTVLCSSTLFIPVFLPVHLSYRIYITWCFCDYIYFYRIHFYLPLFTICSTCHLLHHVTVTFSYYVVTTLLFYHCSISVYHSFHLLFISDACSTVYRLPFIYVLLYYCITFYHF